MAFYIAFNNFYSFLEETTNRLDSTSEIPPTAVADLVEKLDRDVPADDQIIVLAEPLQTEILSEVAEPPQTEILFGVEDFAKFETNFLPAVAELVENPVSAIENGKVLTIENSEIAAVAVVNQIASPSGLNVEKPEPTPEPQISEPETTIAVQTDHYEKYYSLLKKFEISLRYRYDFTDVFKNNRETENFQNLRKLSDKSYKEQRDRQRLVSEKRFEEKQKEQRDRQQAISEKRSEEKQAEYFIETLKQKLFTSQLENKGK